VARDRRSSAIVMVHDYPPLTGGGLALGVRELADLLSVDHDVCVLSSRWRDHFADDRRVRGAPGADAGTAVARAGVGHAVRRFFDADIIITHWTF